jgi:hypothetical protein
VRENATAAVRSNAEDEEREGEGGAWAAAAVMRQHRRRSGEWRVGFGQLAGERAARGRCGPGWLAPVGSMVRRGAVVGREGEEGVAPG